MMKETMVNVLRTQAHIAEALWGANSEARRLFGKAIMTRLEADRMRAMAFLHTLPANERIAFAEACEAFYARWEAINVRVQRDDSDALGEALALADELGWVLGKDAA